MVKVNRRTCFQVAQLLPGLWPALEITTCLQLKVKGEPAPTFTWLKEGKPVDAPEGTVLRTVTEHPDPAEQSNIVSLQLLRSAAS
jgi:hypothetical protein